MDSEMNGTDKIIAGTAFEIVARSFSSDDDSGRNSFRVKNLTRNEALEFLNVWRLHSSERGLERVRLLVASDSHEAFPLEFRANAQHSITYYRNNNEHGLVYIETKVESDEQGLKNLFTLRDVNFLDGTFDGSDFLVPEEMFRQALKYSDLKKPVGNQLLSDRLVEVLRELNSSDTTVSVRKFASFVSAAANEVALSSSVYAPEDTDALVGRCLVYLDMFPDEHWRQSSGRVARRLSLNRLRAELAASPSSDLDREKTAQDCTRTKFVDESGELCDPVNQSSWRQACTEYCLGPSREKRERIPYRIFEQVFSKDVKGLPLGQRVAEEIRDSAPSRKSELDNLAVEKGLDNRSLEDARKLLESEPADSSLLPLKDLLSKQTLRKVEKLSSPAVERIQNPLIKLSQVATDFRANTPFGEGEFRIELRLGAGVSELHTPTLGLFAFLYGRSLIDICRSLMDAMSSVTLFVDDRLTRQVAVPALKQELDPEDETSDTASSEEIEGTAWLPLTLEFVLINSEDDTELDSEVAVEWLPEDLSYLAIFWISVCGEDRGSVTKELHAPTNRMGAEWLSEVVHRRLPFVNEHARDIGEKELRHPIIDQLMGLRAKFRTDAEKDGLSSSLMNDTFDGWCGLLAEARTAFIPEGNVPEGMIEFLNADCVQDFDSDRVLMLQSHPLKLRWIAAYLDKSSQLAADAIEGSLKLNEQNENLYLSWIQGLSPHQQPSIHTDANGHILFAAGELGWTENFHKGVTSGGAASGDRIHATLVMEIVRQIIAYLHAHPYKADGLTILIVTGGASALPADIVQAVRKGEFKNLSMTIELVAPRSSWDDAARQFELVDTDNRLAGDGALFPPVQLNLYDLEKIKEDADTALGDLVCDLAIVPQFLDDNISTDAKTEDETGSLGKFDPLLDDPTYIASGADSSALWVSLRPKMPDTALSDWSTLAVRHERRNPVAADRPEATDFIDIRINFHNTARFFGALHKRSHWVITVERHITRKQIEKLETSPEVLSLRDGVGPGGLFTLIVSSSAGKQFVIDRLARKLKRIAMLVGREELAEQHAHQLSQLIYDEARQISPRLTLDALGISRVTEEILGLSIARQVADYKMPASVNDGFIAWISLDEHPEWFGSANSMRADMIRLSINLGESGLEVDLLVLESKLRRSGYDAHGAEQVRKTLKLFEAVFPSDCDQDSMDGKLWRDTILSAVDTVSEDAVAISFEMKSGQTMRRSRVSEEIRSRFREGDFATVKIRGLYSICEYSHPRGITEETYDADVRVQIVQTGGSALLDRAAGSFVSSPIKRYRESQSANDPQMPVSAVADLMDVADNFQATPDHAEQTSTSKDKSDKRRFAPVLDESRHGNGQGHLGKAELDRRYQVILDNFGQYGISVNKTAPGIEYAIEGPASILFRVRPGKGVAPNKLSAQHDALKLALELDASQDMRFDIDKGYVTIDVPKRDEDRYFISASDLWSRWERPEFGLSVPLGEDRFGNVVEIDFTSSNSPHLLIGGTTGSGKSEALNTILAGITQHYLPEEVRLQLIDPKGTELAHLSESEHLDGEIGWDEDDAIEILVRAVEEMQGRYIKFKSAKVRTLADYNTQFLEGEQMPRWVIVLDEYADLTSEPESKKTIEGHLKRLAQKARAAGIHVIIATQKPDATVISTNLRSNLPAQLALRVKSSTESRVIMDNPGAESLTGKGDAFFKESGVLVRVQCAKI
jgi:S-DNA-T family DNA segregation ATPase FtsK/SpoIIIE